MSLKSNKFQYFIFLLIQIVILNSSFVNAQVKAIDKDLHKKLSESKEEQYRKIAGLENKISKNQEDFDAKYYSLDLHLNPATEVLTATVEGVYEVGATSITQVELNFYSGMIITDIHLSSAPGTQLSYTHTNDLLIIDLGSTFTQGQQVTIIISYNGSPQFSNYNSFDFGSYSGQPMIWTRSEPYGARAWWPCKDIPADKADSVDIRISAPSNLTVASNGTLMDTTTSAGYTTWWWHEQYPIVTYLVSLDVYPYTVYYDDYVYNNDADTMHIHFYVFPNNYNTYFNTNALVKDMIACFDSLYGPYPFIEEKYGHADDLGGGAMEHQTCSSFSFWGETVYAHELAHQWWGDLITCNSFHHIWLNEGFATYSEALWYEHAYPPYTASEYQMNVSRYLGGGTIYVEDPYTQAIFHGGLSYDKGSWVVHMLRGIMGDSTFFDFLRTYYRSVHQFGTATTEEFQLLCEQETGIDLTKFFQQWIYSEYYPNYSYGYNFSEQVGGYKINLTIDQIQQNTGLFWMPINIKVTTTNSYTTFVVWDSLQSQTFELIVDEQPVSVELDPDNWILKESQIQFITPYTQNTKVNKAYQIPGIDTLIVTSEIVNPDNHNILLKSIIENNNNTMTDTISMFDDGLHQDSLAGDGIFGGMWAVPLGDYYFNISVKTISLDSGYYNIINNSAQFTTVGPVILTNYEITSPDTIPHPGDILKFQFTLKNESATDTVYNISTKLTSLDTCSSPIASVIPNYGDIAPNGISTGDKEQFVRFYSNCPDSVYTKIRMDVYSDETLFWSDTMDIFLTKDPTTITLNSDNTPKEFSLTQNFPNPFNPTTTINFDLSKSGDVSLVIYNLLGQEVKTLVRKNMESGSYSVIWNGKGDNEIPVASGIYIYEFRAGSFIKTQKMILMK
jgi:peptidase M1-like protein/flagellar hook capping protein FlgD